MIIFGNKAHIIELFYDANNKNVRGEEMEHSKLKQVAFSSDKKFFYFAKDSLYILTEVDGVKQNDSKTSIELYFKGGRITVWEMDEIQQCRRPANLLVECEICFALSNEFNEHIGYLYVPKKACNQK